MINRGIDTGENRWFYTIIFFTQFVTSMLRFKQESLDHMSK